MRLTCVYDLFVSIIMLYTCRLSIVLVCPFVWFCVRLVGNTPSLSVSVPYYYHLLSRLIINAGDICIIIVCFVFHIYFDMCMYGRGEGGYVCVYRFCIMFHSFFFTDVFSFLYFFKYREPSATATRNYKSWCSFLIQI